MDEILQWIEGLPQSMRVWMQAEPTDDITNIEYNRETLPDGQESDLDGKIWMKRKLGNHCTIRVTRGYGMRLQVFVCINGQWEIDKFDALEQHPLQG